MKVYATRDFNKATSRDLIATVTAQEIFPVETLPNWVAIGIHVTGVTLLLVLFGEVIPKLFAASRI